MVRFGDREERDIRAVMEEATKTVREARGDSDEAVRAIDFIHRSLASHFYDSKKWEAWERSGLIDKPSTKIDRDLIKRANLRQLYQISFACLVSYRNIDFTKLVDDNATVDAIVQKRFSIIIPNGMTWAPLGLFKNTNTMRLGLVDFDFMFNSLKTMKRENRVATVADLVDNSRITTREACRILEWLPSDELDEVASRVPKVTGMLPVSPHVVESDIDEAINGLVSHSKKALKNLSVYTAIMNDDELLERFVRLSLSPDAIESVNRKIVIDGEKVASKRSSLASFMSTKSVMAFIPRDCSGIGDMKSLKNANSYYSALPRGTKEYENHSSEDTIIPLANLHNTNGKHGISGEKHKFLEKCALKAIELGYYRAPTDRDYDILSSLSSTGINFDRYDTPFERN